MAEEKKRNAVINVIESYDCFAFVIKNSEILPASTRILCRMLLTRLKMKGVASYFCNQEKQHLLR